jgi:hypothetical protein
LGSATRFSLGFVFIIVALGILSIKKPQVVDAKDDDLGDFSELDE